METPAPQKDGHNQSLVVSYLAIRKIIGFLGLLLSIILVLGLVVFTECDPIQNSISDYYYTIMGDFFVGTLCAVSLVLFTYRGYEKKDLIAGKLASLFALGIAFFPTSVSEPFLICDTPVTSSTAFISSIHFISATLFFLTISYFSLFLFTKSKGNMTDEKKTRNLIYLICGIIMLTCMVAIALYLNVPDLKTKLADYKPVFYLESIALFAFGISWLTKGEFIFKDKKDK